MKKTLKSVLSLTLAVAMIFSLSMISVSAASTAHNVAIALSSTTGEAGDTVTVSLTIDGTAKISGLSYKLSYDPAVFEVDTTEVGSGLSKRPTYVDGTWFNDARLGEIMLFGYLGKPTINVNEVTGKIGVASAASEGVPVADNEEGALIGKFTLKVKAGAASGNSSISLTEATTIDIGETATAAIVAAPVTYTVTGGSPTTYTLTAGTATNGSLSFDPPGGTYNENTVVTVTATADSGYEFVAFTGASTSTTNPVQITMDGNKTIGATFELIPPTTYTLTAGTATNGSLSFDPPGGTYEAGTVVTVTATADLGYTFVAFTGASTSSTNPVQITMDGNKTIGATFELIPPTTYTLTAGTATNGSLSFDPPGGTYEAGTVVTVTATADAGYAFVAFTGASTSTTNPVQITMDGNKTIGAEFALLPPTLYSVTYDLNGGTGTAPTQASLEAGQSFTVADVTDITAPGGFEFKEWNTVVDGSGTAYAPGSTFTVDAANVTLYAIWQLILTTDPTVALGSVTGYTGTVVSIPVSVMNVPAGVDSINFSVEFDSAVFEFDSVALSAKLNESGISNDADSVAVATLVKDDETIADNDVIATVKLKVKSTAALGATSVSLYNVYFGTDAVTSLIASTVTVQESTDPNLPAALTAVANYVAAPYTTLAEIAIAEGLEAAARTAIAALDSVASADQITALTAEVNAQAALVAAAKTQLLLKKAALENINSGTFTASDLGTLGVANVDDNKVNAYKVAVAAAQYYNNADLTADDLQIIIDAANAVTDAELGNVDGVGKVLAADAKKAKEHGLYKRSRTGLALEEFVKEAVRSDVDKSGMIDGSDITAILLLSAQDNL